MKPRQPRRPRQAAAPKPAGRKPRRKRRSAGRSAVLEVKAARREVEALRIALQRRLERQRRPRWNAEPEEVRRSVARLVLTLVEFIRQLLERQVLRRMRAGSLTPAQVETLGLALMELERAVGELARQFDLDPKELNLDLGVGRLL